MNFIDPEIRKQLQISPTFLQFCNFSKKDTIQSRMKACLDNNSELTTFSVHTIVCDD